LFAVGKGHGGGLPGYPPIESGELRVIEAVAHPLFGRAAGAAATKSTRKLPLTDR